MRSSFDITVAFRWHNYSVYIDIYNHSKAHQKFSNALLTAEYESNQNCEVIEKLSVLIELKKYH